MTKYIIKNCPAFNKDTYNSDDYAIINACINQDEKCGNIQNCLLKRIVEKCNYRHNAEKNNKYKTNGYMLAIDILSMLEIQECE